MENKSFTDKFKGAMNASTGVGSAPQGEMEAKPIMQVLYENTGGNATAMKDIMTKTLMPKLKSIGSVDVGALRVVSVSDRVAVQRNPETRFLNFLESRGPVKPITDYQYRILERNIVTNYSNFFNVDASSLPANVQSQYVQRYNTLTAVGDTLQPSFMAMNITGLQGLGGENLFEGQVDDEIVRIRKKQNQSLLANTEVVSESAADVPQLGGMITRSTYSPIAAGGSNLTNALLQQAVDQIAALYGYDQLVMFMTKGQLAVVRDLMINRFPGENSATHLAYMRELAPAGMGLETPVVYQPYPGVAIPCYYDLDMPAQTAIVLKADFPRLAGMQFQGSGVNEVLLLSRPISSLFDLVLCMSLFTLEDPQINSRVVLSGLAS